MKLTVLVDNVAGGKFKAEHGLSFLIEAGNKTILFDSGNSDLFVENAKLLDIDLQKNVDVVVLSHGHWDHGNGLKHLTNKPLIVHPDAFMKRYRRNDKSPVGIAYSLEEIKNNYKVTLAAEPQYLTDDIVFLGAIPRNNSFEGKTTPFIDSSGEPDFVPDDSALVIKKEGVINIITGCSHSGICNIIEYAKTVMQCDQINLVIGGFHLKHNNEQTKQTINYFKQNHIARLYPSHCTELKAMTAIATEFNIQQLKTGTIINF